MMHQRRLIAKSISVKGAKSNVAPTAFFQAMLTVQFEGKKKSSVLLVVAGIIVILMSLGALQPVISAFQSSC